MYPRSLAIDPSGSLVVAGNQGEGSFSVFTVDNVSGTLNIAGTTDVGFPTFFVGFVPNMAA